MRAGSPPLSTRNKSRSSTIFPSLGPTLRDVRNVPQQPVTTALRRRADPPSPRRRGWRAQAPPLGRKQLRWSQGCGEERGVVGRGRLGLRAGLARLVGFVRVLCGLPSAAPSVGPLIVPLKRVPQFPPHIKGHISG